MRLTKEIRSDIARRAMQGQFADRDAEMAKLRSAFALMLYKHEYGPGEALARQLPKGWVDYDNSIIVEYADFDRRYNLPQSEWHKGLDSEFLLPGTYPFPCSTSRGWDVRIDAKHPLAKEAAKLVLYHRKTEELRAELREKIAQLLYSCQTLKQLQAAWPEGEPFFPKEVKYSTALVPITLTHDINKALGLKPVKPVNPIVKAAIAAKEK